MRAILIGNDRIGLVQPIVLGGEIFLFGVERVLSLAFFGILQREFDIDKARLDGRDAFLASAAGSA
jgi:hypothetical protein